MAHKADSRPLWSRRHRLAGFLWLALFLLWLPFEDTNIIVPLLSAIWASVWVVILLARKQAEVRSFWRFALLGLLLGMSIPILAVLFMAFKTGIHAHGFSEYGVNQFFLVLSIVPISAVLGVVFGLLFLRGYAYLEKIGGDSP